MSDLSLSGGIRLPEPHRGDRKTQVGSTQHFTGGIVFGEGHGARHGLESHLEANCAMVLAYRPDTKEIVEQVRFEWFDEFGELHNHFIDIVVVRRDETVTGYAVRPIERVGQKYLIELARIKAQAISQGVLDDFRLFTEGDVCSVELFNARLFHSVRRPDCFGDPVAEDVVRSMTGVVRIGDLIEKTRLEGMGFRALVRLIRSGHLKTLGYERISHDAMVFKAKEV
ncbi:hypothetical protein [Sulfitobacter sp. R18_1]|uniref:hypothetical protein n=1 Tax=Sulfitobacter sp. R18_1 TaxID=2821104 RepID=UPI001ADB096E|nr:hypothetical protein [Sulfitobacter sp. R18_1]MBO9429654.1 hypothetical protein [Sulfitobacter sp. R18_1]